MCTYHQGKLIPFKFLKYLQPFRNQNENVFKIFTVQDQKLQKNMLANFVPFFKYCRQVNIDCNSNLFFAKKSWEQDLSSGFILDLSGYH